MKTCFVVAFVLLLCGSTVAAGKPSPAIGTWEGESICTVRDSPCHDEHVIYRIRASKDAPGKLENAGYKVVDGKELYMGSLTCDFLPDASELRCHYKQDDLWLFKLSGDSLSGTLTIDNGKTLYRKINVKKKRS